MKGVSEEDLQTAVAAYQNAVAAGFVPMGRPTHVGHESALRHAAIGLGIDPYALRRRVLAALAAAPPPAFLEPAEFGASSLGVAPLLSRPKVRVKAGSSPVLPMLPDGVLPFDGYLSGPMHSFTTEDDNTFIFGACGDQHLGSKYARLDVLDALYDAFAETGCRVVFNTGNWIDGEARFNVRDLIVRGAQEQVRYLAKVYPARPGITTYAIAGDDHEGWLAQREGIDVGRLAQNAFRERGRSDWVDLGYMEAPVSLVNKHTGRAAIISVVHPGGGSTYALSYAIQKIIESLDGGEKPAIGLYGHYHKLWSGNIRNVWCVQTGTCQDQTPFMRKKKIEAHVGGYICRATQDPKTGAVVRFSAECLRFFNRGYYGGRWSHSGPVMQGERVASGIAA